MGHRFCDWCGKFYNWYFPMPQTMIKGNRLFFCSENCLQALNKKLAQDKLRVKGVL